MSLIYIEWWHPDFGLVPNYWRLIPDDESIYPHLNTEMFHSTHFRLVSESDFLRLKQLEAEAEKVRRRGQEICEEEVALLGRGYGLRYPYPLPGQRCRAYTLKAKRCKNYKQPDEERCWVHMDVHYLDLAQDDWEGIDREDYLIRNFLAE